MTLYILILQRLLLNRFLRLLMSWDMYGGPAQVWKLAGEQGELESKIEERIINRFAAELLTPAKQLGKPFGCIGKNWVLTLANSDFQI